MTPKNTFSKVNPPSTRNLSMKNSSSNFLQRGMATGAILVIAGVLAVGALLFLSYVSAVNRGNAMEKSLNSTYENNQQILAQFGLRVMEAVQVPGMARDDIEKVARAALEGRYGPDGSKAVFQAINEQNPQVDPELYRKVQQLIESGRLEFQNAQTRLIDQKRAYETALGTFWGGMWLGIAGYPKVDISKFKVITSDRAEQAFDTGKEAPMQLRPAN